MPDETMILSLPLILPAQAQKHVTHNEALAQLDLIVQLTVIDRVRVTAPALSAPGDRHIVAPGATGPWVGQSGRIALYSVTGWQFTQPLPGWRAHVLAEGQTAVFDGLGWSALSDGALNVGELGVSATADATNRLAVSSPATLLNHAGAGHQLKLNKAAPGDTASLMFQTGFGGRAEMGTAGSEDFSVKVSADGAVWSTALQAAAATGEVTLPQPLHLGGQAADPLAPADGTLWLDAATGEVRVRSGGATLALGSGGGGSPGGSSGEIQYNNAGAFAGAADVEIEGGQLRLPAIAIPAVPAAGGLKLFGRDVGGRILPASMGPSGLDSPLQPHVGLNRAAWWVPNGNGTAVSAMGLTAGTAGTATAANVTAGSIVGMMRRLGYHVTTASTSAVVGWRCNANQLSVGGSAAGLGGFHFITRFNGSLGMANASHRAFVGLRPQNTPTDVNPSTLLNMVGAGYDAADSTWQIMANDGAGAATKVSLGAAFPKPNVDNADAYELALFSPSGTAQSVSWRFRNLATGAENAGMITTDLPGTTSLLAPTLQMSVGGVSATIGLAITSIYIETDY